MASGVIYWPDVEVDARLRSGACRIGLHARSGKNGLREERDVEEPAAEHEDAARRHRAGMGFFRDRRPELYRRLAEDLSAFDLTPEERATVTIEKTEQGSRVTFTGNVAQATVSRLAGVVPPAPAPRPAR